MAELKYEIVKECGVLSQSPSGWTKELNLVSWNDAPPNCDARMGAGSHQNGQRRHADAGRNDPAAGYAERAGSVKEFYLNDRRRSPCWKF